jgi:hypothetical protein
MIHQSLARFRSERAIFFEHGASFAPADEALKTLLPLPCYT